MPRKLKYHEQKLLKKVDFLNWKADGNLREVKILRRYHIQDREDYHTYNKICGMITSVRARPHWPVSSCEGGDTARPTQPYCATARSLLQCSKRWMSATLCGST